VPLKVGGILELPYVDECIACVPVLTDSEFHVAHFGIVCFRNILINDDDNIHDGRL